MVGVSGVSKRDELESALRQAREGRLGAPSVAAVEAELAGPVELPQDGEHIWQWFLELHGARGSSGFGVDPIRWVDIAAWATMTQRRPYGWECNAIVRLDKVFRQEAVKVLKAKGAQDGR